MSWSPHALLERIGGDEELARDMARLFVEESPAMMDALRASIAGGQPDEIRRAAHAFKGSVANFVHDGPTAIAYAIEQAGRDGRVAEAAPLLATLETELAQLNADLKGYGDGNVCAS